MKTVYEHLKLHRSFYVLLPVILGLIILSIHFVYYLTGRPPDDGPGVLIVFGYNAIAIVLAIAFTTFVKSHSTLNRKSRVGKEKEPGVVLHPDDVNGDGITDRWELVISRSYTLGLLWLFLHFLH
jgi:hypothetical protein